MADFGVSEALIIGTVLTVATTAGSAVMQYQAQQDQAKATDDYNKKQSDNINAARINNYDQAQEQQAFKNQDAAQQKEAMATQTRASLATALTSAGENGVDGNSVSSLANEYYGRQATFDSTVDYNRNADDSQIALMEQGFNNNAMSQQNQLRPPQYPSILSPILSIGGAVGSGLVQYGKIGADTRKTPGTGI